MNFPDSTISPSSRLPLPTLPSPEQIYPAFLHLITDPAINHAIPPFINTSVMHRTKYIPATPNTASLLSITRPIAKHPPQQHVPITTVIAIAKPHLNQVMNCWVTLTACWVGGVGLEPLVTMKLGWVALGEVTVASAQQWVGGERVEGRSGLWKPYWNSMKT